MMMSSIFIAIFIQGCQPAENLIAYLIHDFKHKIIINTKAKLFISFQKNNIQIITDVYVIKLSCRALIKNLITHVIRNNKKKLIIS